MEELKLQTPVQAGKSRLGLSLKERTVLLGSCFADEIGGRMEGLGFDVSVNPFGTLYNPVSICNSAARLTSGIPFYDKECVEMGAGAGLICSFSHHTSFARGTTEEFLANANARLEEASAAWNQALKVIVTLGTAWCFEYIRTGETVSNCLKIDAKEFRRRRLSPPETSALLRNLVSRNPGKGFIFTVSPIRHLKDGAHGNQLSKSTLLLAVEDVCEAFPDRTDYFPAYEIVMDELRDYRFYAPDMVHPTAQTADYIWSRFVEWGFSPADKEELDNRARILRREAHRPNLRP